MKYYLVYHFLGEPRKFVVRADKMSTEDGGLQFYRKSSSGDLLETLSIAPGNWSSYQELTNGQVLQKRYTIRLGNGQTLVFTCNEVEVIDGHLHVYKRPGKDTNDLMAVFAPGYWESVEEMSEEETGEEE